MQPIIQNKKIALPGWALNAAGLALALLVITASLYVLLPRLAGRPGQACTPQTLALGTQQYEVKAIEMTRDGSLQIPANQPGTAYWVQGTDTNQVFALSLTAENVALLNSLKTGDVATVTADCGGTTYNLAAARPGIPDRSATQGQSASAVMVFVQTYGSAGFTVTGSLKERILNTGGAPNPSNTQVPVVDTVPAPDPSILQAEISLLGVTASPDGQTISILVSILNTGQKAGRLAKRDVSLVDADGKSRGPEASEPGLPQALPPGEAHEFSFNFSHPNSPTATLRVLGIEFDIEGY